MDMTTQKYRSILGNRQGGALYFGFTGEDADYRYADSIPEKWMEDPQTLYEEHDPKAWDAMADGYKEISPWGSRHIGEIAEAQRLQVRADMKARRERQEQAAREAALAEAQRLRVEAKASEQAAKDAERKARELEVANA
jgi:hypothetical protein